jgi:hypothetical protein
MYDFIDQRVADLDCGGQFLVWSMRNWVQAVQNRRCPPHSIAPAFAKCGMISALQHFHAIMMILNKEGLETLCVSAVRCQNISDDEARMLSLFQAGCHNRTYQVRNMAEVLVTEGFVAQLSGSLAALSLHLVDNKLVPEAPMPPPVNTRPCDT